MKKSTLLVSSLIVTIVLLTIIHVVVANMLSTTGVDLDRIQADLTKYKKENVLLKEEVLQQASLHTIASRAAEMGFVESKSPVVISGELPIAKR